jgi:hypothetical protein
MSSLEQADAEAASVATAPRVSLADIDAAIEKRYDFNALDAVEMAALADEKPLPEHVRRQLGLMSVCILVLRNGFVVIGKSAPASPANFNQQLGRKLAYDDCRRQLWPLMGFSLRETLHRAEQSIT